MAASGNPPAPGASDAADRPGSVGSGVSAGPGAPRCGAPRLDELVTGGQLRPRGGRHIKTLLRVDAAALDRGRVADGEVCEISGYGPIPVPAARQLLADSALAVVLTHGTQVLSIANFNRAPTAIQTSVLQWRDPVCSVEGCTRAARLEADHIQLWSEDGPTSLDNLEYKCDFHHDQKTNHGWTDAPGEAGQDRPLQPPRPPRPARE